MNHTVYYSKDFKTLIIAPNLGVGVMISSHGISVLDEMEIKGRLTLHNFEKIGSYDLS